MTVLLDSTLKVTLVVLIGLGVSLLLRRRSAATRHWVIAASLVCAIAVPALELLVPMWNVSLARLATPAPSAPRIARAAAGPTAPDEIVPVEYEETVQAVNAAPADRPIAAMATMAWLLGSGLSLFVLAVGLARLTWLASRAAPVSDGPWVAIAADISRRLGLVRPPRLLETDHPSLLVTWGLVTPKIILPRAARTWTDDRIAVVLRHELAHIRRGDWVVQMAGEILRTAYWFNPVVWVACSRLRLESEQACDDEVLSSGVDGSDYATHLVELARVLKAESAPRLPAPAVARSSSLERRIHAMLDARLSRTPSTRTTRIVTAAALVTVTVAVAAAQSGSVALSGSVVDPVGAPVPGAKVVLANERTRAKFEVATDASGQFTFVPLPADTYALETSLAGFKSAKESVTLSGRSMRKNVALSLGELQETITVVGSPSAEPPRAPSARPEPAPGLVKKIVDACEPSSTGGRIRPPHKIKDVKPIYPASLSEAKTTKRVRLKATIGTDGTVRDVQVVESVHPNLDNAAIEAVRQ
jgi:beta-lactamase regulating signal transducer with metallopeptidase domain